MVDALMRSKEEVMRELAAAKHFSGPEEPNRLLLEITILLLEIREQSRENTNRIVQAIQDRRLQ